MDTWFKILEFIKSRDDLLTVILFIAIMGIVVVITLPAPLITILICYFVYRVIVGMIESDKIK